MLAVSLGLFIAGRYGSELFLTRVSMVGVLAGLILFLAGPAHLRRLVLPIAFLLFMIPLPAIVFNHVAFPLQLLASRLGSARDLGDRGAGSSRGQRTASSWQVSGSGRGVLGHPIPLVPSDARDRPRVFHREAAGPRAAIAIAAVPIAVIANAVRVAGTGLASYWISPDAAEGFLSLVFGLADVRRLADGAAGRAPRFRARAGPRDARREAGMVARALLAAGLIVVRAFMPTARARPNECRRARRSPRLRSPCSNGKAETWR